MKNILKSIFISSFPVIALVVFVKTIINANFYLNDIGLLISSLAIIVFFSMLFLKPVARTSRTLTFYSALIVIGVAANVFNFEQKNTLIAVGLALGWLAYLTWYSTFKKREINTLKVGSILPYFNFENGKKEQISTKNFTRDFSIYLFYRGNWCPLCMAQIKEVVQQYKELEKRNVNLFLVSSQPHKFTQNLTLKYKVPFQFLVDVNNTVAKQIGVYHKNGLPTGFQVLGYDSDVVLPTVIITDKNNKIIFVDLTDNYRVRPEPETFLKIIDTYKASIN